MKYTIGEFSQITEISVYTLRYYEKENLISPKRLENGQRYYTDKDLSWAIFIKRLKDTDMPIKEIAKYAFLREKGDCTLKSRMDMLIEHRKILQDKIMHMQTNLKNLDDKIDYYKTELSKGNDLN